MIGDALQRAQYAALTAAPAVADGRVYDNPPVDALYPHVTIGDEQISDDSTSCGAAWEVFTDVHAWSRPEGASKAAVKVLAGNIVTRLATTELILPGLRIVVAECQSVRTFRDPDGLTEHSVITLRYLIDPS